MAGLVPATQIRGLNRVVRGVAHADLEVHARLDPRDKPGDDGVKDAAPGA